MSIGLAAAGFATERNDPRSHLRIIATHNEAARGRIYRHFLHHLQARAEPAEKGPAPRALSKRPHKNMREHISQ
jgi:hypothetical protein